MSPPAQPFKRIAFVASSTPEAQAALAGLVGRYGNAEAKDADVIVALGGDGLMLQTLHGFMKSTKPIYGMHRGTVLVCGIEAHVCVLQTTLDLLAGGRLPFLCTDCISAGQATQIAPAMQRMQTAGATPTGTLSAIYELLGDATHPSFKACLELVKGIRA